MIAKLNCILLVDDDHATNFLNQLLIKKMDCVNHIYVANDGQEALDFLQNHIHGKYPCPELILLDINMPGMDGWEFLEHYEKLEPLQKGGIVVVMLTTSLNIDDKLKAESLGLVSKFMHKPLRSKQFKRILEEHFPGRFSGVKEG